MAIPMITAERSLPSLSKLLTLREWSLSICHGGGVEAFFKFLNKIWCPTPTLKNLLDTPQQYLKNISYPPPPNKMHSIPKYMHLTRLVG